MPAYRIYWLDHDDRIIDADCLIADGDENVRERVHEHVGEATAVEVWHRARLVARAAAGRHRTF